MGVRYLLFVPEGPIGKDLNAKVGSPPMASLIMVLGGVQEGAGKTTIAKAICGALAKKYQVQFCKPISGHNFWYHYDHFITCASERQLFSRDAHEVRGVLSLTTPIEIINPIDCLFSPVMYERSSLGSRSTKPVLERFTTISGGVAKNIYLKLGPRDLSSTIVPPKDLTQLISGAAEVREPGDWRAVEESLVDEAITSCLDFLKTGSDIVCVEGHDDRCPVMDDDLSLVAIAAPGHLSFYDGGEFRDGFYSILNIRAEVNTRDVLPIIKPLESYSIGPMISGDVDKITNFKKGVSDILSNFF